jgi:tRNA(Glu) U13 pseudouridine synthase TruD
MIKGSVSLERKIRKEQLSSGGVINYFGKKKARP